MGPDESETLRKNRRKTKENNFLSRFSDSFN